MPLIRYEKEKNFTPKTQLRVDRANQIIARYQADGLRLNLRQLYYRFVAAGWIKNIPENYKRLGETIAKARMQGLIDWESIEDRTRTPRSVPHMADPGDSISTAAEDHRLDKWQGQPTRVEVWIEKDALAGVFEPVCAAEDVTLFACRGYSSASAMWEAGHHRIRPGRHRQDTVILHFGDHDPSGIDMTRDIQERLSLFSQGHTRVIRVALNMDQVEAQGDDLPANPAKITDSRYKAYREEFGDESWELDALEPRLLQSLATANIALHRDEKMWKKMVAREGRERRLMGKVSKHWSDVAKFVKGIK